jgi:benzoylformate decarboxylase
MRMPQARDVFLEVLASEGVAHVFGNPGTTELPFIDALAGQTDIEYVLALQEASAVAMADGYAQVTHRPAFLNLHTSAGLGNAIGNLTNARANGTPLVVTAGNADRRHLIADPLLSGDLVGLAGGVSKWGHEVRHPEELGVVVRRAFLDAATPPAGPVFVSIPQDLLDQPTDVAAPPRSRRDGRNVPAQLDELARLLVDVEPGKLAIVAGEEVGAAGDGAIAALVSLAKALAAPVHGSPLHSVVVFPTNHPLWRGPLPPVAAMIRGALQSYERILFVGAQAFLVYPYSPGSPLPEGTDLIQISADPTAVARTHPVKLGLIGDVQATLEALLPGLHDAVAPTAATRAAALDAARAASAAQAEQFDQTARSRYDAAPMHPMAAVHAVLKALPAEIPVVDEAITTGTYVRGLHHTARAGTYFFCRGGGLGWGMPAACGVSLGRGREGVLCVVGDGSAMYSCQSLWTAARQDLPVLFAVVDNRQYAILKGNLKGMGGVSAKTDRYIGMDLDGPAIDFVGLARSMGVDATLVEKAADVGDAARAAWDAGRPHLLHLPIAPPS